jgi:predicted ATPase
LSRFLRAAAAGTTLILLLEHLQWADEASLTLLEMLVEQETELPLLILTPCSPQFVAQRPAWQEDPTNPFLPYQQLELRPLSPIDSRHLLAEIVQPPNTVPLRLVDLIAADARGNPLFMEESMKLLIDKGYIVANNPGGNRWSVDLAQVEATRLPAALDQLLQERLSQLPSLEQQLLGRAAVIGPLFWDTALWSEAIEAQATIEAALLSLEEKGLVIANHAWSFADAQAYTFVHPLLGDVAYRSLSTEEQQRIHQQIAQWLINQRQAAGPESDFPSSALIAHHFAQAGKEEQAAIWLNRAAPLPVGANPASLRV